jgi:hypothetical protein
MVFQYIAAFLGTGSPIHKNTQFALKTGILESSHNFCQLWNRGLQKDLSMQKKRFDGEKEL